MFLQIPIHKVLNPFFFMDTLNSKDQKWLFRYNLL